MRKKFVAAGAVGAVVVAGLGAGAVMAFGADDETRERGTCDGAAYELVVGEDDGGLELEFELQSSGPAEVWQVLVEQDGASVLAGERSTDEDGELDLDTPVDKDGTQEYRVSVTPAEGDPCVATLNR
ncbi:hypothetical protein [Nocardioides dongxiaopingii]|uniref:hypothetical protein n=1 Tax=Nocardioides dongxiaopingii TaxID=2576036 RepID=UPI0010C76867|nr:hypothetical protein [Nocardioides dongxiaopingii]